MIESQQNFGNNAGNSEQEQIYCQNFLISNVRELSRYNPEKVHFGKLLGKGQFGQTYAGRYNGLPVAIKVIRLSPISAPQPCQSLVNEIEILQKLSQHPNPFVVRYIDVFLDDSPNDRKLVLIMELLDGDEIWKEFNRGA